MIKDQTHPRLSNQFLSKLLIISLVLILISTSLINVSAQSAVNNWSQPVNISQSGATTNPHIITSASGRSHAVWEDQYSQIVYKYLEDGVWSSAFNLDLPFYQTDYILAADQTGWVFAFWIDYRNYTLYYSGVQELSFATASRWFSPIKLASGVTAFDVSIDDTNQLNLVYLRALDTGELPSGVYYQKTQGNFQRWGNSILLYESKYFRNQLPPRGVTVAQSSLEEKWSHVDIEAGAANQFYISWENPALKRLFYSYSAIGGNTWSDPIEISSPTIDNTYLTPQKLLSANLRQHTMQIWQLSEPGGNCSLQFRTSLDSPNEWTPQQSLSNLINECPENITWHEADQDNTIFIFSGESKFTILAWNGERWSLPQSQTELNQFINPTTFSSLEFIQFETEIDFPNIYNIAVDRNSGDIWYSQKTFGNLDSWYNSISEWSTISNIVISEKTIGNLTSFAGLNGLPYFIWSVEDTKDDGRVFSKIQIAEMDEGGFIPGYLSIRNNLSGKVNDLNILPSKHYERLSLTWQGGIYGQLISSWADLNQLNNPVGWSEIYTNTTSASIISPYMSQNLYGEILSIYYDPLNENKGIYLSRSDNGGESWGTPDLIFPSEGLIDCPIIKDPQLIQNEETYHLMYTCYTDSGGIGPLSLNYTHSSDYGETWAAPQVVQEGSVYWSKLIAGNDGTVHRLWLTYNGETAIYHGYSLDDGKSWIGFTNFSLINGKHTNASVVLDYLGNIHFLQPVPKENNLTEFLYHFWNGNTWSSRETLELFTFQNQENLLLTSTIDQNQNLTIGIIINSSSLEPDTNQLITARFSLGLPTPTETEITFRPTSTPVPESEINQNLDVTNTAPSFTPSVAPTISNEPAQNTNTWVGIVTGSIAAFGLLILVFLFIRRRNS